MRTSDDKFCLATLFSFLTCPVKLETTQLLKSRKVRGGMRQTPHQSAHMVIV